MRLKKLTAVYEVDGEEQERVLFELGRQLPGRWTFSLLWTDDGVRTRFSSCPPEGWPAFLRFYGYGAVSGGKHPMPGPGLSWSYPADTPQSTVDLGNHIAHLASDAPHPT